MGPKDPGGLKISIQTQTSFRLTYNRTTLTETRQTMPNFRSGLSRSFGLRMDEDMTRLGVENIRVALRCTGAVQRFVSLYRLHGEQQR